MSFPPKIKTKALIACGRCCCLCKKFCGTNIEVHHIIPQAQGGDNSFENAIPLCFDCHAEVERYNPSHPKGNKYKPDELKKLRDEWYSQIEAKRHAALKNPQKQSKDKKLVLAVRVKSGAELCSCAANTYALHFNSPEPKSLEEASLFSQIHQEIYEMIDELDCFDGALGLHEYEFLWSKRIEEIENQGYLLFATTVFDERYKFNVLVVQLQRKDSAQPSEEENETSI